jgi:hypothetical protein
MSTLALVVVGVLAIGIHHEVKEQARKKRKAGYQSTLLSYTQVLKPGMTRKEVEGYFHAKNINFGQTCCVDPTGVSKRHSLDDLVGIGREDAPWFCSENNVYLAFEFVDQGQHGTYWDSNDADTLKAVSIYQRLGGCL